MAWTWGAISWAVLPWHHRTFLSFEDEGDAARWFLANCRRSGVFGLPAMPRHPPGTTAEARLAAETVANARMKSGPIVTAIVTREGFGSVPAAMARAFAIYAAASLVISWLLMNAPDASYWRKTADATAIGLAAGLICRLPDWNWHGYSTAYTAVCVADHVVGGFLTGLAIAAII